MSDANLALMVCYINYGEVIKSLMKSYFTEELM